MKRQNRFSTSALPLAIAVVAAAGGLQGCATMTTPTPLNDMLAPLDLALYQSPAELRRRAEAQEAQAQLAMSIVAEHGLHGERPDSAAAVSWVALAVANRRTTPITQYTAAFNNRPSQVNLIYVPVPAISAAQVAAVTRCVNELSREAVILSACGDDAVTRSRRRQAWLAARR